MDTQDKETLASRYLGAAGSAQGDRYGLAVEELAWLVEHASHLSGLRLGLLRALQAALPRSDDPGLVPDLKGLLTDLIIMQSRSAGREERLHELLRQLVEAKAVDSVPVDEAELRKAMQEILEAAVHVKSGG